MNRLHPPIRSSLAPFVLSPYRYLCRHSEQLLILPVISPMPMLRLVVWRKYTLPEFDEHPRRDSNKLGGLHPYFLVELYLDLLLYEAPAMPRWPVADLLIFIVMKGHHRTSPGNNGHFNKSFLVALGRGGAEALSDREGLGDPTIDVKAHPISKGYSDCSASMTQRCNWINP